jgi:hypothetical protein
MTTSSTDEEIKHERTNNLGTQGFQFEWIGAEAAVRVAPLA